MAKYNKKNRVSEQTRSEAMAVARSTQKAGQTKEQTKLIAQGIQKGIEIYKKQQKEKTRDLNKRQKNASTPASQETNISSNSDEAEKNIAKPLLPWLLLVLSWCGFAGYVFVTRVGLSL
ncbi:DUF2956 family protein [Motiliproteus sp. MSK22-1]|uniref:DUF2956 family protein n=1 Tax=Motiliproteus sp. MSK22-1 TaxID=1897630 RepID=UPI000975D661|nr:DUF2956 family protein [Motiliproteus sp. MSK22-1]OMH33612.1 hypothetical protein BGP75_11355 [Motiliproteus sp. MSK22-1]